MIDIKTILYNAILETEKIVFLLPFK